MSRSGKRKKLLIVDGYNVLRSGSRYSRIALPDYTDDYYNVARERLVNDVISYAGAGTEAIIVYDAGERRGDPSASSNVGGVRIMFSQSGRSADQLIEKLSHDARERGVETLVVTSDAGVQDTVFGGGIDRMSAEGFCQELSRMEDARKEKSRPQVSKKNTIADRISPAIAEKLREMRDA